jgi:hypothetical protein
LALTTEGRGYFDRVLALVDAATPPADAARVVRRAAILWRKTNRQCAVVLMERAAALYRQADDQQKLGATLGSLGGDYVYLGRHDKAKALHIEAHALFNCRILSDHRPRHRPRVLHPYHGKPAIRLPRLAWRPRRSAPTG